MSSAFEKFERRVRSKLKTPSWAIDYLKSGLPADLNLDGALNIEIFKQLFFVERPHDDDLDRRIMDLFKDSKHNMLCIESGRGSGKSTFVQTLHLYDPEHEYEYSCIDFSNRDIGPDAKYSYCEDELFDLFRKRYRRSCKNQTWHSNYEELLELLINSFSEYTQSKKYIGKLKAAKKCITVNDYSKLFPGNRKRI